MWVVRLSDLYLIVMVWSVYADLSSFYPEQTLHTMQCIASMYHTKFMSADYYLTFIVLHWLNLPTSTSNQSLWSLSASIWTKIYPRIPTKIRADWFLIGNRDWQTWNMKVVKLIKWKSNLKSANKLRQAKTVCARVCVWSQVIDFYGSHELIYVLFIANIIATMHTYRCRIVFKRFWNPIQWTSATAIITNMKIQNPNEPIERRSQWIWK